MATRMKLKLKTVFVLYFMVSLLGLIYALMQLGEQLYFSIVVLRQSSDCVSKLHKQKKNFLTCLSCLHFAGQRCDCTEHDIPKDRTISRLRGELHRLQEQIRKSEATKQPQKPPARQPTVFVITPTYAR